MCCNCRNKTRVTNVPPPPWMVAVPPPDEHCYDSVQRLPDSIRMNSVPRCEACPYYPFPRCEYCPQSNENCWREPFDNDERRCYHINSIKTSY